jgi:hypothetical protein
MTGDDLVLFDLSMLLLTQTLVYVRQLLMASGSQFHYQPIQLSPQQIRLLIVQPGRHNESIRCTLVHVCLDKHSEYEALSYMGGHPSGIHDDVILLQGARLQRYT